MLRWHWEKQRRGNKPGDNSFPGSAGTTEMLPWAQRKMDGTNINNETGIKPQQLLNLNSNV